MKATLVIPKSNWENETQSLFFHDGQLPAGKCELPTKFEKIVNICRPRPRIRRQIQMGRTVLHGHQLHIQFRGAIYAISPSTPYHLLMWLPKISYQRDELLALGQLILYHDLFFGFRPTRFRLRPLPRHGDNPFITYLIGIAELTTQIVTVIALILFHPLV